jgi:hypothetical protein
MTYLQTARNLERHIFISIKLCKSSGIVAAELQSDAYLMYRSGTEQFNDKISLKDFLSPPTHSERDFLGWCVRGCWVTQARAYLIMIRGLFLFLKTANSTILDLAGPRD